MGAIIVLLTSFVASLIFSNVSQNPAHWLKPQAGRVLSTGHAYEPPMRKSIIIDTDGLQHSTADNTRPTRRDRSFKIPRAPRTADIQMEKEIPTGESSPKTADKKTIVTAIPSGIRAPMPVAPMPGAPIPARQYQIEEVPLSAAAAPKMAAPVRVPVKAKAAKSRTTIHKASVHKTSIKKSKVASLKAVPSKPRHLPESQASLGRRVKKAILSHSGISNSAKVTLTVTSAKGKVVLRGIVKSADEKARIARVAARIAGTKKVSNQLIIVRKKK